MADAYETGTIFTSTLPSWQRDWYELALLETLRKKSVLVPFTILKEDFSAVKTKRIIYSEVYDMEPNWNSILETSIWFKGGSLDSRTQAIDLLLYHNILKFSDYHQIVDYINRGDMNGLANSKLGINLVDTLDILCRNAYMTHPFKLFSNAKTSRANLISTDIFDLSYAEGIRTLLHEDAVPGIDVTEDGGQAMIVCITTPRVIHDIRNAAGSEWTDVNNYHSTGRKFTAEVGSWGGVRFMMSNRLRLRNHGAVTAQGVLQAATVPGQGAPATVDTIYTVGQTGATTYVQLDTAEAANFSVGDWVTIHADGGANPPVETDGTQEDRRIVNVDTGNDRISFHKPLLKDHASGARVTKGLDVNVSLFLGAPGVVYAVGERPNLIFPPKIDDAMSVNRVGWRGFFKFQLFRPEVFRVVESAGSAPLGQAMVF